MESGSSSADPDPTSAFGGTVKTSTGNIKDEKYSVFIKTKPITIFASVLFSRKVSLDPEHFCVYFVMKNCVDHWPFKLDRFLLSLTAVARFSSTDSVSCQPMQASVILTPCFKA